MIKYTIINFILLLIFTLVTSCTIKHYIEKHSVHPDFKSSGNISFTYCYLELCDL
jgi:hypothetical protein